MKHVIEAFSVLFVMILNLFLCMTVLTASADAAAAKRFTADVVAEIENSNFNSRVVESCRIRAEKSGYELAVIPGNYGKQKLARVRLTYSYRLPLLALEAHKTTEAVAR